MKNISFYNLSTYRKKQSIVTKANWQKGIYDSLSKKEKRECAKKGCGNIFEVKKSDKKKFCSWSCAAKVNNLKRSDITPGIKNEIEELYKSGFSMMEISEKTGLKYGRVVRCMKKFDIPRRSWSEATYVKRNPDGDPFKIKNKLNKEETLLKGLGLGLYWGEGDKSDNNTSVRLSNTDPQLIKVFREFLIKICGVKKEKFRYALTLFNDCDEKEAVNFWQRHVGVKRDQLGKITIIPPQGKGTYKKKSQVGVFAIIVTNKKLKYEILNMLN